METHTPNINRSGCYSADPAGVEQLLQVYLTGEAFEMSFDRVEQIQSLRDFSVMKRISTPFTPHIFSRLTRYLKKIWKAEGFALSVEAGDEEIAKEVEAYFEESGLREFMRTTWSRWDAESPNSIIWLAVPNDSEGRPRPEPQILPYEHIEEVKVADNHVDILSFTFEVGARYRGDKEEKVYRTIDVYRDYLHFKDGELVYREVYNEEGELLGTEPDIFVHGYGFCPAEFVGEMRLSKMGFTRINMLYHAIVISPNFQDLFNEFLRTIKHHAFPLFYSYPAPCGTCKGSGEITQYDEAKDLSSRVRCGTCEGTKMNLFQVSDASEGIVIQPPQLTTATETLPNVPIPAGYIDRPTTVTELQLKLIEIWEGWIEKAVIGQSGVIEKVKSAVQTILDYEPVKDSFNVYADLAETKENALFRKMAHIRYNTTLKEGASLVERVRRVHIKYGRKHLIKSENELLSEFATLKEKGAPSYILDTVLQELTTARFEFNPQLREEALLKLEVEPFPAYTVIELKEEGIVPLEMLHFKRFYPEVFDEVLAAMKRRGEWTISALKQALREAVTELIPPAPIKIPINPDI